MDGRPNMCSLSALLGIPCVTNITEVRVMAADSLKTSHRWGVCVSHRCSAHAGSTVEVPWRMTQS